MHQGEGADSLQHLGRCGQERLWVTSAWQWSPSRLVTLIFLHYVIRMIIFPPFCLKTHFRSNLSQLKQLSLVWQRTARGFHYTGCLTLMLSIWTSPFFTSANIMQPHRYHPPLPPHRRRSPCQQHHQPTVRKTPWDFSKSGIWRGREAPAAPGRCSLGGSVSGGWDVQVPGWDGARLGGAWSWAVSACMAQWCRLCLVGGLCWGFFPSKLQPESIKVLALSVPHCRKKRQAA